jgi:SulP family sulfate permease
MNLAGRLPGRAFEPKLVSVLRHGYHLNDMRADAIAGLTVAVVALPLAMALAIASGTTPDKGLHTAIIAGFLISALGGSKVQVGGPTAAFIPVVFNVIERYGYDGLLLATLMAGVLLVLAGVLRLGNLMKFMPQPVVTGFTAGIAVTIFVSQIKDALGLSIDKLPGEFFERLHSYFSHMDSLQPAALLMTLACLAVLLGLRRWRPNWPAFLIVVILGALAGTLVSVATIGSTFGALPTRLPQIHFPEFSMARMAELLPSAFTIAFLAGVESLLSAVVADGMTDGHHRSNAELVAQGVANVGSAMIGGLPATGAIARTATSIRAGARSPVAGMAHALFLLVFMLLGAELMAYVPLPALAAVLLLVAWNMSEVHRFRHLMRSSRGDRLVLLATFILTVVFDLTVAIEVGVVLAAFVFMQRMSAAVDIQADLNPDTDATERAGFEQREALPQGVEACRVSGPLFFAAVNRLDDVFNQIPRGTRVFILRMREVPMIDASGEAALRSLLNRCQKQGIAAIFSGMQGQPQRTMSLMGLDRHPALLANAPDFVAALASARAHLGEPAAAVS